MKMQEKAGERKLRWDEENRLLSSDDNGFVTNYWYDADGERTVKTSGEGEQRTYEHCKVLAVCVSLSCSQPGRTLHQAHLHRQPAHRIEVG